MDRSLPAGVVPADRSARIRDLPKAGLCPFDDRNSPWYSPVSAPADSEDWWLE